MNNCFAIIAGICITFSSAAIAEKDPMVEYQLEKGIVLMKKAVEEAEKGNYVLGSPYEVCPGKPDIKGFPEGDLCEHPSFSCRCF